MIEKKINKIATHLFQTINSSKNQSSITSSNKWGGNEQAKTATSMELEYHARVIRNPFLISPDLFGIILHDKAKIIAYF